MRVGNKYLIFIDPEKQEATDVIVSRSNNKEAYTSLQKLAIRYGADIRELKDKVTKTYTSADQQHLKTTPRR